VIFTTTDKVIVANELGYVSSSGEKGKKCADYNVMMTSSWILVIPRSSSKCFIEDDSNNSPGYLSGPDYAGSFTAPFNRTSVSINGLGFLGYVLADDEISFNFLKASGPLKILECVSFPM